MHKAGRDWEKLAVRPSSATEPVSADNHADDSHVRFIFRTTDETLWFDKNGSKAGGLEMIADLQGSADLTHQDIFLI